MAQTFFVTLTEAGEARLANAQALGIAAKLTHIAVGDGNGTTPIPMREQKALVHEIRRAPINSLAVDPKNPSRIVAEQVIPEDVGGWWIREIGLFDDAGVLCAVANCPPTYKPLLAEGSGRTQVVRMVLLVTSTDAVELKIDPAVVLATREYCDTSIATALADKVSRTELYDLGIGADFATTAEGGTANTLYTPTISGPKGVYLVLPYNTGWTFENAAGSYYMTAFGELVSGTGSCSSINLQQLAAPHYDQPPLILRITSPEATVRFALKNNGSTPAGEGTVTITPGSDGVAFVGYRIG